MKLKKIKYYIYDLSWWNTRIFAILFLPFFIIGIELFFLLQTLICEHILAGVQNIMKDYINNIFLQAFYKLLFYNIILQYIRINMELWF